MGLITNIADTPITERGLWGLHLPAAAGTYVCYLFQNDIVPGPTTKVADFVEADFTGYGNITVASCDITHSDPSTGLPIIKNVTPLVFNQTGTTITNTIYGWWIDDGAGQGAFGERFDTPIQMDATGKQIQLLFNLNFLGVTGPSALED
jgi:hypothetical protein